MLFFKLDLVSLVHLQAGVDTYWPDFDAGWVVTGMGLGIMVAVGIGGCRNQWQMWW